MRRPLIVGNWKMNGSKAGTSELLQELLEGWQGLHEAEVAVCAPFVYLEQVGRELAGSNVGIGAQDLSPHANGAHTGDISGAMLSDMQCDYVIVGHSERRRDHGENNELVARKCRAASDAGLTPILCVGETLEQRDAGEALEVIGAQLQAVNEELGRDTLARSVVAYEPVWAIGTGRSASPKQAQEAHRFIREQLGEPGAVMRLLYGGSVKAANAEDLFGQPDIDGGLIGGASLDASGFIAICRAAELPAERGQIAQ